MVRQKNNTEHLQNKADFQSKSSEVHNDKHAPLRQDNPSPIKQVEPIVGVERYWLEQLPKEGCHRIIIVEEITKKLAAYDVTINIFELDLIFQTSHNRVYKNNCNNKFDVGI